MMFLNKFILIVLISICMHNVSYATEGYIKHKIINDTPYELFVGVRQQFSYPIFSCLGTIDAHAEKECDGPFEIGYSNFMIEVIKNSAVREELRAFANFKNYVQNPSFNVVWTLSLDDSDNIKATYLAKNF
jgi:hypothetical protein